MIVEDLPLSVDAFQAERFPKPYIDMFATLVAHHMTKTRADRQIAGNDRLQVACFVLQRSVPGVEPLLH